MFQPARRISPIRPENQTVCSVSFRIVCRRRGLYEGRPRIAYVSYPEGVLWQSEADGSDRHELSFLPTEVALPRWSPDGKQIAFASREPGKRWKIFVVAAEGGSPEQLTSGDSDDIDPSWSPDGNSLAFGGYGFQAVASKENAIHILDLKTRKVTAVPGSAGLFSPHWSPDGRYLQADVGGSGSLTLYISPSRNGRNCSGRRPIIPTGLGTGSASTLTGRKTKGCPSIGYA